MSRTVVEDKRKAATPQPDAQHALMTLGIAPVIFSGEYVRIGRLNAEKHGPIKELREKHRKTHAFRFDARDGMIANIGLQPGIEPMGEIKEARVGENLLLLAMAIEHKLWQWLLRTRKILRRFQPLICLGDRDRLLTIALRDVGIEKPDKRIDVVAKWSFDLRLLTSADPDQPPWLGLLADVSTSNVIDVPVSELLKQGFDPVGCYVGPLGEIDDISGVSRMRLLGRVTDVEAGVLILDDVRDNAENKRVNAANVFLEPRPETLEAVVQKLYPAIASKALHKLRHIRAPYLSGEGKLDKIRRMVMGLNESLGKTSGKTLSLTFSGGFSVSLDTLLDQSSPYFPPVIETTRPNMLFGPSGHDQQTQPDVGIQQYGPFQYAHNPINEPMIVVLCDKQARGRMDQFAKLLRDGLDGEGGRFSGGLVGKFRLTKVRFHFTEIAGDTGESYEAAAGRALEELPQTPALALVQVRSAHRQRIPSQNPYFVAKSRFMRAGVPVQAVRLETVEETRGKVYTLNNLALAAYAKIGGVPWVISTPGVATHELVIGIGCTEIGSSRLGDRARYVGITTLFQGDGRYLVWETTREATFEHYPEALLESLRRSVRFVRNQNKWEAGDPVRLVFHVYKPLKRVEIKTVKTLVNEMLQEHPIEFSFLDVSHYHPFQIFDPSQSGDEYWSLDLHRKAFRGVYAPSRGTALLLGPRTALLQLVGVTEVKTWEQGIPRPLLLELHRTLISPI